ncbi:hypothetical protein Bbelb_371000, partial [Branchiostoma belcheri]
TQLLREIDQTRGANSGIGASGFPSRRECRVASGGKTYYSCTTAGHNRAWCALTAVYDPKKWKNCDASDLSSSTQDGRQGTFSFTTFIVKRQIALGASVCLHFRTNERHLMNAMEQPSSFPEFCTKSYAKLAMLRWARDCLATSDIEDGGNSPIPQTETVTRLQGCHFPFTYRGKTYYSCTTTGHNRAWCALTAVYDPKKWKNCDARCHFPFTYKGTTYTSCTSRDHNRPWCALTAVYQPGKWKNCDATPPPVNPVCLGDLTCPARPGQCSAWGDPHYITFDGRRHDFQGTCKYVLVRHADFTVAARNVHRRGMSQRVAFCDHVEVNVHNYEIHLRSGVGKEVLVNGYRRSLPVCLDRKVAISVSGRYVLIQTDQCLSVLYDGRHSVIIRLPTTYKGKISGMCGNYNGQSNDDNLMPTGQVASTSLLYGNSWIAPDDDTCPDTRPQDNFDSNDITASDRQLYGRPDKCGLLQLRTGPFGACISVLNPATYFGSCLFDMAAYRGDEDMLCENLEAYSDDCTAKGGKPGRWRTANRCPMPCPAHSHYDPCGSACPLTCTEPTQRACIRMCVESCVCDQGYILSGSVCVPRSSCGCSSNGNYYQKNEVWRSGNQICKCTNGRITCEAEPGGTIPTEIGGTSWDTCPGSLSFVTIGWSGVWGVNSRGVVFYRVGTAGKEGHFGKEWKQIDGNLAQISSGKGIVWGVNSRGKIYVRTDGASRADAPDEVAGGTDAHRPQRLPCHRPPYLAMLDSMSELTTDAIDDGEESTREMSLVLDEIDQQLQHIRDLSDIRDTSNIQAEGLEEIPDLPEPDGFEEIREFPDPEGLEDFQDLPESEGLEEFQDLPESEGLEEIQDLPESEGLEEFQDLPESDGLEDFQDLPEPDGLEEFQDIPAPDGLEEIQDLPESEGLEEFQDLPESEGLEDFQDLPESDGLDESQDLPEPDGLEEIRNLPEPGGLEEIQDLPESEGLEEFQDLSESEGLEDFQDLPESDGLEESQDLPEPDGLEEIRNLPEPDGLEEFQELPEPDGLEEVAEVLKEFEDMIDG